MRSIRQRPSLWYHIKKWDTEVDRSAAPRQLVTGGLVVRDSETAHRVLSSPELYREQSAFLRTRTFDPLPRHIRNEAISGLMAVLDARPPRWHELNGFPGRGWHRTQGWGIGLMRHLYADALADRSRVALNALVDRYVARKTIQDDAWGGYRRLDGHRRDDLHAEIGAAVRACADDDGRHDLAHVVAGLSEPLSVLEQGELYARLVQSVVGFTGTFLEFAVYATRDRPELVDAFRGADAMPYLREMQRLFPTAWRLTRTVAQPHVLGGVAVEPGDVVLIATSSVHRSTAEWSRAREFEPARWSDGTSSRSRAYLPFGRGPGMCPGRNIALEVVQFALANLFGSYRVQVRRSPLARPYVRSLLAAPTSRVRFVPLTPDTR